MAGVEHDLEIILALGEALWQPGADSPNQTVEASISPEKPGFSPPPSIFPV